MTGEPEYADYRERNLWNGILAQQHPETAMVAYFLPLGQGGRKTWSTPTETFWCCLATCVQAHSEHNVGTVYASDDGALLVDLVPLEARSGDITLRVEHTDTGGVGWTQDLTDRWPTHRPDALPVRITVDAGGAERELGVRIPWWASDPVRLVVDGEPAEVEAKPGTIVTLRRAWSASTIELELGRRVVAEGLPDDPRTVALVDGPMVLAGRCDDGRPLPADALSRLEPDDERVSPGWQWGHWRLQGPSASTRFVPLHEITDEAYTERVRRPWRRGPLSCAAAA